MKKKLSIDLKPTQILILGFLLVIFIGAFLLGLPIASKDGKSVPVIDALFTSTSAVCVTGLVVVNTLSHWTVFGKIVILVLIQIGGLGFMTITTSLFIILGKKIRLKERLIIQEAMNQYTISGMVRLTKNVILGTFLIEGIGALLLSFRFVPEYGWKGIFVAIFHSVSAFCNAGFDIIGDYGFNPYVGDVLVNLTLMILIIIGGLGFSVWMDFLNVTKVVLRDRFSFRRWFRKLSLQTKLVFLITGILIVVGFVFFFAIESYNPGTIKGLPLKDRILASLFQSVTTRTAGYNTITQGNMTDASKFMTIILMFIGGSPAGTAGGIKTVTFGVIILAVISVVSTKDDVEVFGKKIPKDLVLKSITIAFISMTIVLGVTMGLSLFEHKPFFDLFFEAVSAFATVGLSVGITPQLTVLGKLLICITMFFGRLGPITIAVALALRSRRNKNVSINRPEEKVMVG